MKKSSIDNESIELLFLSSHKYLPIKLSRPCQEEVDIRKLINIALENNLLVIINDSLMLIFRERLNLDERRFLASTKEKELKQSFIIKNTLNFLNYRLKGHLLLKTYRGYNRFPNDLDILVKDLNLSVKILLNFGFKLLILEEDEAVLIKEGYYRIHLHNKVTWCNKRFMDPFFIINHPRTVLFHNSKVKIPNYNSDFLIHLAHINYEPLHLLMSEMLYLFMIYPKTDYLLLFNQASKYSWGRSFLRTMILLNSLHFLIYNKKMDKRLNIQENIILKFPLSLPPSHIIKSFLEKMVIIYPLLRLGKVLKILIKSDSFTDFIEPPEKRALIK